MTEIKEVTSAVEKSIICNDILRALPNWFGVEDSIVEYTAGVKNKPFYGVFDSGTAVGFVSVLVHNPYTAEIYVMGISEACHGQGIGKKLVVICEKYCHTHGIEFLTVKTLDASREDPYYESTRKFYHAVGFRPLEVFTTVWGEANPCLFLAKYIGRG